MSSWMSPAGKVIESCASINAVRPVPVFSIAIIERDRRGLTYSTLFITNDSRAAHAVSVLGVKGELPDGMSLPGLAAPDETEEEDSDPFSRLPSPRPEWLGLLE